MILSAKLAHPVSRVRVHDCSLGRSQHRRGNALDRVRQTRLQIRSGPADSATIKTRRPAVVVSNEPVCDNGRNRLLVCKPTDGEDLEYAAGNVFALAIPGESEDGKELRGPYTVSEADEHTFCTLYRIVEGGRKTPLFAHLEEGAEVTFDGRYHEPIIVEAASEVDGRLPTAVVGISTGSGVGPLWGFAKQFTKEVEADASRDATVRLFCGYRDREDICMKAEMDALQSTSAVFSWKAALSSPPEDWDGLRGRVTDPAVVAEFVRGLGESTEASLQTTHFHLVGNGGMLAEVKEGLARAGVPEGRVTTEVYHNYSAQADQTVVQAIANTLTTA